MSSVPNPFLTPVQYLEIERKSEGRSEYADGQIYAMSGASRTHCRITLNVAKSLDAQSADGSCEVMAVDMRVRAKPDGPYYYPDVSVVCGEPRFEDAKFDVLLNPKVIMEVLSPSTESYDRGEKFENYRDLKSLSEYLLIAQDRVYIEHHILQPSGHWESSEMNDPNGFVELRSIGATLKIRDVYDRVAL